MVGCVLVHEGEIISEAYHEEFGKNHAERNAILQLRDKDLLRSSTLYVNLEPCSHHGKTPPCADLIIDSEIPEVVIGMQDPHDKVSGTGITRLLDAGIKVTCGVLENECRELNKKFIWAHENERPYITLKWARTMDGFMGRLPGDTNGERQISSEEASVYVHKLRTEHNIIAIGAQTANSDNPMLNVRKWSGRDPVKVIFSPLGSLQEDLVLFESGETIVYTSTDRKYPGATVKLEKDQFLMKALQDVVSKGFHSILVEGGAQVLQAFLESGLWNEAHELVSQSTWDTGVTAPVIKTAPSYSSRLGSDTLNVYSNAN